MEVNKQNHVNRKEITFTLIVENWNEKTFQSI